MTRIQRLMWLVAVSFLFRSNVACLETKPLISIDLIDKGLPSDFFRKATSSTCPHQYVGYRAVQWVDSDKLLVAFNTVPDCSGRSWRLVGNLKILTYDLQGKMLQSAELHYEAGGGRTAPPALLHDGIWIG